MHFNQAATFLLAICSLVIATTSTNGCTCTSSCGYGATSYEYCTVSSTCTSRASDSWSLTYWDYCSSGKTAEQQAAEAASAIGGGIVSGVQSGANIIGAGINGAAEQAQQEKQQQDAGAAVIGQNVFKEGRYKITPYSSLCETLFSSISQCFTGFNFSLIFFV
jgi:hypothetical protein